MGDKMPEVDVSIIIPCYNRWSFLPEVVSSIVSQTFDNWEIVLVDDASENTPPELKLNERTKYFRLDERRGSGYARNFGVKQCKGKFILFVDDDVVLSPTYIASLLRVFCDHSEAGAVGGRLLYVKGGEYYSSERYYDTPVRLGRFSGEVLGVFNRKTHNTVQVPALHMISLLKKEDFLAVGGFDEITYVGNRYREETDLFMRIRETGRKLFYCPTALAYHFAVEGGGQRGHLLKNEYYVFLNHTRFLKKHYSNRWFFMLVFFVFRRFYDLAIQLFSKTTRFFHPNRWRKFSARMED
jgi:GT2 family glycosyltransferase